MGGREKREDGYLGLWEVYSEISEEWQTATEIWLVLPKPLMKKYDPDIMEVKVGR